MIPALAHSSATDTDGDYHEAKFLRAPALDRLADFLLAAFTPVTWDDRRSFTIGRRGGFLRL